MGKERGCYATPQGYPMAETPRADHLSLVGDQLCIHNDALALVFSRLGVIHGSIRIVD